MNNIRVVIKQDEFDGRLCFALLEYRDGKTYIGKTQDIVMEELKEGENHRGTFIFPRGFDEEFIEGMKQWFNKKGIRTNEELKLEGKMIATEKHLEDMRKLIFKEHLQANQTKDE